MGNRKYFWGAIIVSVVILVVYLDSSSNNVANQQTSGNPTIDVSPNVTVDATVVNVARFYDGQDGYSISIPSGNRSTCVWNWEGGNAAIPDSTTTYANTATEKHTVVYYPGSTFNYAVNCFDDFGNQYVGVFPEDSLTTQASITESEPIQQANQIADGLSLSAKCDVDSENYFKNGSVVGTQTNLQKSYTNYLNKRGGTCYVLEKSDFTIGAENHTSYILYDVDHKDNFGKPSPFASYAQAIDQLTNKVRVYSCHFGETPSCSDLSGFFGIVDAYMKN